MNHFEINCNVLNFYDSTAYFQSPLMTMFIEPPRAAGSQQFQHDMTRAQKLHRMHRAGSGTPPIIIANKILPEHLAEMLTEEVIVTCLRTYEKGAKQRMLIPMVLAGGPGRSVAKTTLLASQASSDEIDTPAAWGHTSSPENDRVCTLIEVLARREPPLVIHQPRTAAPPLMVSFSR